MNEQPDRTNSSIAARLIALLVFVAFVGLFYIFVWPVAPPARAQSPATSASQPQTTARTAQQAAVGRNCRACHREIVESFALGAHGKAARFLKDSRAAACEICHDNSEKHAETSSLNPRKMGEPAGDPSKMSSSQANETCLQCHARDRYLNDWRGGQHDRNDMSCMSCHNEHHTKMMQQMSLSLTDRTPAEVAEIINTRLPEHLLATQTVEETCFKCHATRRKDFFQRSTHLFRTELRNMKVGCTSCHNPHGGEDEKMLVSVTVNDVCYTCHAEKRGPFLWDHPPVRENCLNCHSPHGSSNPKLLNARVNLLCQQCHIHMLPRHSTTAGQALDIWNFNRGCLNCHGQIHGSNHPGGRTFTR